MKSNYVRIAGGIGNQLFQIAFGESLSGSTTYFHFGDFETETTRKIIENFGGTLLNLDGYYKFKKLANLTLRFGSRHSANVISNLILENLIVHEANRALNSKIYFNLRNSFEFSKEDIFVSQKSELFIGYFQSYIFADYLQLQNNNYLSVNELEALSQYTKIANLEKPIAIQVRLGDYLSENTFGIPSIEYFRAGVEKIDKLGTRKIWVFTNDNEAVFEFLPEEVTSRCRIIDEPFATPLLTLFIMSLASDFVISNSTFGWWGAYLRGNQTGRVVVPDPWFAKASVPINLIPPEWIKLQAGF